MRCPKCNQKIEESDVIVCIYNDEEIEVTIICDDCSTEHTAYVKVTDMCEIPQ